ncbi:hypothetical protein D3C75_855140 [compost metagenome]
MVQVRLGCDHAGGGIFDGSQLLMDELLLLCQDRFVVCDSILDAVIRRNRVSDRRDENDGDHGNGSQGEKQLDEHRVMFDRAVSRQSTHSTSQNGYAYKCKRQKQHINTGIISQMRLQGSRCRKNIKKTEKHNAVQPAEVAKNIKRIEREDCIPFRRRLS